MAAAPAAAGVVNVQGFIFDSDVPCVRTLGRGNGGGGGLEAAFPWRSAGLPNLAPMGAASLQPSGSQRLCRQPPEIT